MTDTAATVTEFFRATNAHDSSALLETFAEDAVVYNADEGTYRGHDGIAIWNDKEFIGAGCVVDVTRTITTGGGQVIATGDTRGDFPGGRIVLFYLFRTEGDLLTELTIHH